MQVYWVFVHKCVNNSCMPLQRDPQGVRGSACKPEKHGSLIKHGMLICALLKSD